MFAFLDCKDRQELSRWWRPLKHFRLMSPWSDFRQFNPVSLSEAGKLVLRVSTCQRSKKRLQQLCIMRRQSMNPRLLRGQWCWRLLLCVGVARRLPINGTLLKCADVAADTFSQIFNLNNKRSRRRLLLSLIFIIAFLFVLLWALRSCTGLLFLNEIG